jgi:hypothetical protein
MSISDESPGSTQVSDPKYLQQALAHVFWMGGSPCSGKTSIARALVERYGMRYFDCDQAFWQHNAIVTPERQPVFYRVMHLSSEALWMRPVEQQTSEEIAIYREEFPLILKDLLALPDSQPVLAEGAALLPECVAPLLNSPRQGIWIVPTADFQLHYYSRRDWAKDYIKDTSDPQQAFQNWMQRDIHFARFVCHEAEERSMRVLVVDGACSIAENIRLVEEYFQLNN